MRVRSKPIRKARRAAYPRFRRIDGRHPVQRSAPRATVDYRARRRRDGEVAYFNFALAKEMGLLPESHPERLNPRLRRAILDTFGLAIINEWDQRHGIRFARRDCLPHLYMATRYLQLQHPDRRGRTSGDGRSIWNGTITHGASPGTSRAAAPASRACVPPPRTRGASSRPAADGAYYGCGTAALGEGLGAALSRRRSTATASRTERVLAVIALPDGFAINVRAGRNLLRPSHFFAHSKQGDLEDAARRRRRFLLAADRERRLAAFARTRRSATDISRSRRRSTFARAAATFESEYVFCWLDWDGDNVLADGGIVDYGSVRQFGLYHREYRFDDVDRLSTTFPEQRRKARAIVQSFAQIRDFLIDGRKAPLASHAHDPALRRFDAEFEAASRRLLL